MSWFRHAAEHEVYLSDPVLHALVKALAELEERIMVDLSALQKAVSDQGAIISQVQAEVASLKSSGDQAAVDAVVTSVTAHNAALSALLPST